MYKTAIDYYKEPVNKTSIYSQYKGPLKKSNESFKQTVYPSYITPPVEKYESFKHALYPSYITPTIEKYESNDIENHPTPSQANTNLIWKTDNYNNTSDPNVWGPAFWFTLHNGASRYPLSACRITKERMKGYILGIPYMIPCEKCRHHATDHIIMMNDQLDDICSGREKLFAFFVDFHNIVNKRYNKPIVSVEEAFKMYTGKVSVSKLTY